MDKDFYHNCLIRKARPIIRYHELQYFQLENNPKHTAKQLTIMCIKSMPAKVREFLSQLPYLNPKEILWSIQDGNEILNNRTI